MDVEVFVHPTCSTCHSLIRLLRRWGMLDKVKVYDTSVNPQMALERGVRSVPSIFIDGELVFAGVVDFAKLRSILASGLLKEEGILGDAELIERFLRGVLDSVATALWLYVNEKCSAFTQDEKFLAAITNLTTYDPRNLARLKEILMDQGRCIEIINGNEERFLRVIAVNFTRELYWLLGRVDWSRVKQIHTPQSLAHWMMVRGSVSRVGLIPHSLAERRFADKVAKLWSYLESHFSELMDKVASEQGELLRDPEWAWVKN